MWRLTLRLVIFVVAVSTFRIIKQHKSPPAEKVPYVCRLWCRSGAIPCAPICHIAYCRCVADGRREACNPIWTSWGHNRTQYRQSMRRRRLSEHFCEWYILRIEVGAVSTSIYVEVHKATRS